MSNNCTRRQGLVNVLIFQTLLSNIWHVSCIVIQDTMNGLYIPKKICFTSQKVKNSAIKIRGTEGIPSKFRNKIKILCIDYNLKCDTTVGRVLDFLRVYLKNTCTNVGHHFEQFLIPAVPPLFHLLCWTKKNHSFFNNKFEKLVAGYRKVFLSFNRHVQWTISLV